MNNVHGFQIQDWQLFFTEFKRHNSKTLHPKGWELFFTEFKRYYIPNDLPPQAYFPDISAAKIFFQQFQTIYDDFEKSGGTIDVWEVADIGKDELRNSAILGWLLDCYGSHGQGSAFLRKLLEQCGDGSLASTCAHGYRTTVEESYDEFDTGSRKQRSRVDVVLDGAAFLLLIEVKVRSRETDNQLERYLRIGRARAGVRPWRLVYLTVDGRQPSDPGLKDKDKIDCVSWHKLGRAFLRHVDSMPDSFGAVIIRQFCEHIINL